MHIDYENNLSAKLVDRSSKDGGPRNSEILVSNTHDSANKGSGKAGRVW